MNTIIRTDKKPAKITAVLLTAALVLTIVVTQIGNTYAAPTDIEVTLECESGIDPAYHVEVGQKQSFSTSNLWDAYSSDKKIATVGYTQGVAGTISVTGVSAGVAAVAFGTKTGILSLLNYQITDSNNISAYNISGGGEIYFSGPGENRQNPVTIPTGSGQFSRISWKSMNSGVAYVASNGNITSTAKGVTTIVGSFTDKWGVKRQILISVGVESGDSDRWYDQPGAADFSPDEVMVGLEKSYSHPKNAC